jgi:hypothetical protein
VGADVSSLLALLLLLLLLSKLLLRIMEILTQMHQSFYFTGEATPNIHLHDRIYLIASTPFNLSLRKCDKPVDFCLSCFERRDLDSDKSAEEE